MELRLHQETLDWLCNIELPDILENCGLEDPAFDDIANLLQCLLTLRDDKPLAGLLIRGPLY